MQVIVDSRWVGIHGIQRFAAEVLRRAPRHVRPHKLMGGPAPSSPASPFWLAGRLAGCSPGIFFSPGYMAPAFAKRPVVVTLHDLIPIKCATKLRRAKTAFYQCVLRPAARRAARVLTVSEFSKREIMEWLDIPAERVVVVGNGVDESYRPGADRQSYGFPYVLYVGANKPHKNLPRLIAAFASPEIPPEVKLVLTGSETSELAECARDSGVGHRVVFAGELSEHELVRHYRGASAVAMVSLYEGFGLPVLEAMACGTPVVVSNLTSLPEVAGDAAIYVDPYDVDSIAGGLSKVLRNQTLGLKMIERGLERAKLFSWDQTAHRAWSAVQDVSSIT